MMFYGMTMDEIRRMSSRINDQYYVINLGEQVEVDVLKKDAGRATKFLSECLAEDRSEDKLGITYKPSNKIYFDADFIDNSGSDLSSISCLIDAKSSRVVIGEFKKYPIKSGTLTLSGTLSLNGYLQFQRPIYFSERVASRAECSLSVVSLGLLDDSLFGLYLIPSKVGVAIGELTDLGENDLGFSVKTYKLRDCTDWKPLYIDDLFSKCRCSVHGRETDNFSSGLFSDSDTASDSEIAIPLNTLMGLLFSDNGNSSNNLDSKIVTKTSNNNCKEFEVDSEERVVSPIRLMALLR